MNDIEKAKKDFNSFMELYVARMKIEHQRDMGGVLIDLFKILLLAIGAVLYTLYGIPLFEALFSRVS